MPDGVDTTNQMQDGVGSTNETAGNTRMDQSETFDLTDAVDMPSSSSSLLCGHGDCRVSVHMAIAG